MTPADFAAHVLAPGIMNESDGDATIKVTGDEFTIVVRQTRRAPGWEEE